MEEDSNSMSSTEVEVRGKRKRAERKPAKETHFTRDKWTTKEKQALLAAVKALGPNDTEKLAKHLNTRDKDQIFSYLRSRENFGKTVIKEKNCDKSESDLEKWFGSVRYLMQRQEDFSQIIGDAVGVMAANEETVANANPKERMRTNDLFELHTYLKSLLSQEITPVLSLANQKVLSYLIDMLWRVVDGVAPSLQNEIQSLNASTTELLTKPMVRLVHRDTEYEDILKSSLNPLQIPQEVIEKISIELMNNPVFVQEVEEFVLTCLSN